MPSNFLQWNPSAANQENDSQYAADAQRIGGAANPSVFTSATGNKLFYQVSTFIAALAQSLSNKGYQMTDANMANLAAQFNAVMTAADMSPYALSAFVQANYAPLVSAALQGTPTAPTPAGGDNSSRIANTAWVQAAFATTAYVLANFATQSYVNSTFSTKAYVDATFAPYSWVNTYFQPILNFTPVQQGGGANQGANKVYIGWDNAQQLRAQIDATDIGPIALTSYFANSLASSGYQKLANGLILQWGFGNIPGNGTAIGFPLVFPNGVYQMVSNDQGGAGASGVHVTSCVVTSNSGFNAFAKDSSGGYASTNLGWLAIGH